MVSPRAMPQPVFPLSDHCDGRSFFNPRHPVNPSFRDIWRWKRHHQPAIWPRRVEIAPQTPPLSSGDTVAVTWINHASFLLQTPLGAVLTDPVYSPCCGPWGRLGPRRVHAPGIPFAALPPIAAVLLSHDHYDHCDLPTLARLARAHDPLLITPLGNAPLARRAGLRRIVELDWWQAHQIAPGLTVTATPSRHWSNRLSGHRNHRLWSGFHLRSGARTVQFVGDTGYDDQLFGEIPRKLGAPDLAIIPIGAYEPRWFMAAQHCNPAEAVQIHRDLGARRSVAMHWGCFQLTDEPRDEPPRALAVARAAAGLPDTAFTVLEPGASLAIDGT